MSLTTFNTQAPYMVTEDAEYDGVSRKSAYQSISFSLGNQNLSCEEIRLSNYQNGLAKPKGEKSAAPSGAVATSSADFRRNFRLKSLRVMPKEQHVLDGESISFLVGTSESGKYTKRFAVHEDLIKPRSEFVRMALRGEWKEAANRTISLPDDDPAIFQVYQGWLYTGLIHTRGSDSSTQYDEEYETLVKAYILGDKLIDPVFQDCIADALVEKLDPLQRFNPHLTSLVFDNTPPGCPLKTLWVDIYYHFGYPEWINCSSSVELLVGLSRLQMLGAARSIASWKFEMFSPCYYHRHGANPCYRSKAH